MLELYIFNGKEKLRCGYTTGTCAAIAAKACALMLFTQRKIKTAEIITPKGIKVEAEILDARFSNFTACCAVKKDGGDDNDVTDGILIYAEVALNGSGVISVDGGRGVGRVTKKGLKQNIGEAAINETPKRMIEAEVKAVFESFDYQDGASVVIFVPQGEEIAKRTFNPSLGIENGISILGTGGIVEPKSVKALTDSIFLEMEMLKANGTEHIILTPGNYGQIFLESLNLSLIKATV
ncbi:MAG: cobalt-precorrin-5B (C(1))-methyltransferase CbiD [Oscillospiraceae bacterium]